MDRSGWGRLFILAGARQKNFKKLNKLIKDIERNRFSGIGKPEALRGDLSGWWSRRIDESNRIVYRIVEEKIEITLCRGLYER